MNYLTLIRPLYRSLGRAERALSLTPAASQEFKASEDLLKERYDGRVNEDIEKKRARLLYQSRKRGMLENGVILASFADKFLNEFTADQLDQYDRLINLPTNDWDIYYWATKTKPTPAEYETPIMQKLREHLKSKVSKMKASQEQGNDSGDTPRLSKSILDNRRSDDIVMPAIKKQYPLNVDVSEVSLMDYEAELFDNRTRKLGERQTIQMMTTWRKQHFLRRLRRTISSPVSLRHLNDDKQPEVFTQKAKRNSIGKIKILQTDLVDSLTERNMKHHNFLQHLLGSTFTDNVRDYDDEAEAWADAMWHRNYGSSDSTIAPSQLKCNSCHATLHCCDHGLQGYLPKEVFAAIQDSQESTNIKCQRCKFTHTHNVWLGADVSREAHTEMLRALHSCPPSIMCLLIDLTDFPSGIWTNIGDLVGNQHRFIVVGNKLDLLPNDGPGMIERVTRTLKQNLSKMRPEQKNLNVNDVMVLSARTGFGVEGLVSRLLANLGDTPKDIYLLGCSNSGKSTLFNALLQSDLSAIRKGDLMSRVSIFKKLGYDLNMLRFPIANAEGWEVELKKRRTERVERNYKVYERSLESCTSHRQATIPHMSMLINRIECGNEKQDKLIKFTDDHPLAKIEEQPHFSATIPHHAYFHHTPSASHEDQLHPLLTNEERLEVFPHETMIPRKYSIRPLQSILIAGLARLDLLTSNSIVLITIFASRYLPIHVIPTRSADRFYRTYIGTPYLGVPFGDKQRLKAWPGLSTTKATEFTIRGAPGSSRGSADIVLSSVGWAMVQLSEDQECIVKAFTPKAKGISHREPPLLPYVAAKGKKIRDTPMFVHPNYAIESRSAA